MNLSFTLSGFADEISSDLDTQMDLLEELGIHHMELRSVGAAGKNICECSAQEARSIKEKLDARGFTVSCIASPFGKSNITEPFGTQLETFIHALDLAEILETGFLRMYSFRIPSNRFPDEFRGEILYRWRTLIESARGRGIVLLQENKEHTYADTPERCLELLETLDCDFVRAVLDPAGFVLCGADVYPDAYELLRPYIEYLHIKDAHFANETVSYAGQGDAKYPELLQALQKDCFHGFLSIEPHLCSYAGRSDPAPSSQKLLPAEEGPRVFREAKAALDQILLSLQDPLCVTYDTIFLSDIEAHR